MTYVPDEQDEIIGDAMAVGGPAFVEDVHYAAHDAATAAVPWDGNGPEPVEYGRAWRSAARRLVAERRAALTRPPGEAVDAASVEPAPGRADLAGTLVNMTEHSSERVDPSWSHGGPEQARAADPWAPGGPTWPHPAATFDGGTAWVEGTVRGRVESADHLSPWGAPDPPASVPDPIPGTYGPHTGPGWLTRGRGAGPAGAA